MKPAAFAYERPATLRAVLEAKARWGTGARYLAGGQSLVPALNMRLNQPECLIDLNGVAQLRGIREEGGEIVIGALARHSEVIGSSAVAAAAPLLRQAGRYLAHAAIRNRGTFGGSVALADPAAEWPAACLLLGARMRIAGAQGLREVAAHDFFRGLYATALGEDELLESVVIPRQAPGTRNCVLELARRHGDYASAAVMATARPQGRRLTQLRLVFFAVADLPLQDPLLDNRLEEAANGADDARIEAVARDGLAGRELRADLYTAAATKRHLCGVLARRAVRNLQTEEQ